MVVIKRVDCIANDQINSTQPVLLLFDLILYVPSTIFQLYRGVSSWVEPILS